jgi:hypothetical protein
VLRDGDVVRGTKGYAVPLPLIPAVLIGVGVITGAGGLGLAAKGGYEIKKANHRIRAAGKRYAQQRAELEAREQDTNYALKALGANQERAVLDVVCRMAEFLRRHEKQVSESEKLLVDGLDLSTGQVGLGTGLGQDAVAWMRGVVGAAAAGVGMNVGVTTAVTTFAAAGTGTAISTLSGAAATNATLAFLGGGPLAAGGGGMALGAVALNFVTIGPALLVSGLVVAGQGEKATTQARKNEAAVNVAIAQDQATMVTFDAIIVRAHELESLLGELVKRAIGALAVLESTSFDPSRHAVPFQQALTLTMAVRDVASTAIIDESGDLNEGAAMLKVRYRSLIKETQDG